METFAWEHMLVNFSSGTSLGNFPFGTFAWKFALGAFVWELSFGNVRLKTLVLAEEVWFRKFLPP